jgi:cytokinin riboside 5'-monophosphate phosphoribohydrolase
MIQSVTVYCSSSSAVPPVFREAAAELGGAIASTKWKLVYGGNNVGLMGVVADACRAAGGKVIGITPQLMVDQGICDRLCDELLVTTCMRERKALLEQRGDAFVTLPGGLGTFEEIFEIIVGKQLRYHTKPIVLLNVENYFGPLLAMIEHGIELKFIKPRARDLYFVAPTVAAAVDYLHAYVPPPVTDKWFVQSVPSGVE